MAFLEAVQTCSVKNFFIQACNVIKKETLAQVFSCEFYEISQNTFGGCFCFLKQGIKNVKENVLKELC